MGFEKKDLNLLKEFIKNDQIFLFLLGLKEDQLEFLLNMGKHLEVFPWTQFPEVYIAFGAAVKSRTVVLCSSGIVANANELLEKYGVKLTLNFTRGTLGIESLNGEDDDDEVKEDVH